jgi:hypothetical protein
MYRFDPNKKELTANEVAELMMYLVSAIMRPMEVGRNNVKLDEAFYNKLPSHLQECFDKE